MKEQNQGGVHAHAKGLKADVDTQASPECRHTGLMDLDGHVSCTSCELDFPDFGDYYRLHGF